MIEQSSLLPSLADYVFEHARIHPLRTAMASEYGELSYANLAERVQQLGSALQAAGVKRGDRVAVLTPPRSDAYSLFIALNAIGAIWVGINPVYQYEEMAYVVDDAQPVALVYLPEFQQRQYGEDARRLFEGFDCLELLLCLDEDAGGEESIDSFAERLGSEMALPARILDDIAMIVYTSGSTGNPKGCMLPNKAMAYRARVQWQNFQVSDYPRVYCPLPLNHVGGMQMVAGAALFAGGTVNFREKFVPGDVGEVVARGQVNFMVLFPTMYQLIVDDARFDPRQFDSLQCINFSGGVISRELLNQLLTLGSGVVQTCFGSTETCIGVIFSEPGLAPEILVASVGRPVADDCRVVNEQGQACKTGEIGEFQVLPDFCMAGYFNRPAATAEAFTDDGWLRSGDLVQVLPDGSFRFSARSSEMYKSGGYNIYPREIEIAIEAHPAVVAAAVCGVPDALYGEVGYAFVQPMPAAALSTTEVQDWCRQRLANYKIPKQVECVDSMPLLPNGKLDKAGLRKLAASRVDGAVV